MGEVGKAAEGVYVRFVALNTLAPQLAIQSIIAFEDDAAAADPLAIDEAAPCLWQHGEGLRT